MDQQGHRVTLPKLETPHPPGHSFENSQKAVPSHRSNMDGLEEKSDQLSQSSSSAQLSEESHIRVTDQTTPPESSISQTLVSTLAVDPSPSSQIPDAQNPPVSSVSNGKRTNGSKHVLANSLPPSQVAQEQQSLVSEGAIAPLKRTPVKRRTAKRVAAKRRRRFSKLWTTSGVIGLILFSGLGVFAYRWLTWLPPDPDCQNLPFFVSDSDRLYCAQQAAQEGNIDDVLAGINLTANWPQGHPMYQKSREVLTEWSAAVLEHAEMSIQQAGLDSSIALVSQIPSHSSLYDEAQNLLSLWQQQWTDAEAIHQQALAAIEQQDWSQAAEQVTALGQVPQPYWREDRAHELSLIILNEQQARKHFEEAIALANTGRLENLATAVSILKSIPPETATWQETPQLIEQWGETLVAAGVEALASGDVDTALQLVQHLPITIAGDGEAYNLLQFSFAKRLTEFEQVPWRVAPTETFQLSEAIATAQQISADSALYPTAQEAIAQWQHERNNVNQLQTAQWIAHVGSRQALELAIHEATSVGINEPRRIQAQTLIAHWKQELHNIQYRPQLAVAQRIAAEGTEEALKSAIAHVQSVRVDPIQWPDSTQWINQWTRQLQAIEDRPILIAARELATQGDWEEAIARASDIGPERSLYSVAQDSIEEWQAEFQLEQNTAYLAQARQFADQVRLTQAIARASLIQRGQPLYEEAQRLISQWVAQRNRIRASQTRSNSPENQSDSNQRSDTNSNSSSSSGSQQNSYEGYYDSRYYDYHR
ncbi:MAG: hypothetical protein AAFR31_10705 [Cyanobacteria bacterium J06627_8]